MVTNLQFAAVAAYLLWCLFASVSDRLDPGQDDAEPVIDERDKNVPVR
jgi:hypothetical protein